MIAGEGSLTKKTRLSCTDVKMHRDICTLYGKVFLHKHPIAPKMVCKSSLVTGPVPFRSSFATSKRRLGSKRTVPGPGWRAKFQCHRYPQIMGVKELLEWDEVY